MYCNERYVNVIPVSLKYLIVMHTQSGYIGQSDNSCPRWNRVRQIKISSNYSKQPEI